FQAYRAQASQTLPTQSAQFYPNMRYTKNPVTYYISEQCDPKKIQNFQDATDILSQETLIEFERVPSKADIMITCSNISPEPQQHGHFVAGEGGPSLFINTTRYAIIVEGEIALYRTETCDSPQ